MDKDYVRRFEQGGVGLTLYRGEGAALLAFDLDEGKATPDFAGFAVEVRPPGGATWYPLKNRLRFEHTPFDTRKLYPSLDAPFQKFRWIHVPADVEDGEYGYRVTARYMRQDRSLVSGGVVTGSISLAPATREAFLNVGFTRGFASSQAYTDKPWKDKDRIIPSGGDKGTELDFDTKPFRELHYPWLGFEARTMVFEMLDRAIADEDVTVDALLYECREPDFLERLERLGGRLRAIIDDHGEYGDPDSPESRSEERLRGKGAQVHRLHFGRQQHNKELIVRRGGHAERVLTGSTNFTLRGLYIQSNNALLFDDPKIAGLYGDVFDAYWSRPKSFQKDPLALSWHVGRDEPGSRYSFCFSPHSDCELSLGPVADAIFHAESSVLYAVCFLNQLTGDVRGALEDLANRSLFSYGIAQRAGGMAVHKPDGSRGLVDFAFIGEKTPEPFRSEWSGGQGQMVHHKFVVTDFNGKQPKVFTGSSNLAAGGEKQNGDNLILVEDPKVAVAYGIEALRLFDHFHFRVRLREGEVKQQEIDLAKPPADGEKPWFAAYYRPGHVKERDRKLFSRKT